MSSAAAPKTDSRARLFFPESWPLVAQAAMVLGLAIIFAYHNTFSAPFVFDDLTGIVRNPTIRQLWPLDEVLFPAPVAGSGAVVFPLVNLSFALNYAMDGVEVTGYHVLNLLMHLAAATLLFSVVHRALRSARLNDRFGARAFPLALAVALLWALHPLQTASVKHVMQRGEVMAGFFLLLTLDAFIRATEVGRVSRRWVVLAIVACLAGMAAKETMAAAPILVLLYDRTFISQGWRESVRRHGGLHLAFAATWLLLFVVIRRSGDASSIEMGLPTWTKLLAHVSAAGKYLALSFWPSPLVFDYGAGEVRKATEVWLLAATLALLTGAAVVTVIRRPPVGFIIAGFLLALTPGVIIERAAAQAMGEHRLYVALAAPITFAVTTGWAWVGRRGLIGVVGLVIVCGALTFHRNQDYSSALNLWRDTVAKVPENPRAHYNFANALSAAGRAADAVMHYQSALRLDPRYAAAHHNLAGVLLQSNRAEEAVAHYRLALRLEPDSVDSHVNLAAALVRLGRMSEAVTHYEAAARSGLLAAEEQLRFGRALAEVGRIDEALVRLLEAARLNPQHAETRVIAGMVLSAAGRTTEALQHFIAAVVTDPNDAAARAALGDLLIESSRPAEALVHYEAALRLQPDQAAMFHTSIGNALVRLARAEEAIFHYESALQLNPENQEARAGLKMIRAAVQRRGLLKN